MILSKLVEMIGNDRDVERIFRGRRDEIKEN